jgi:DNA repair exonuclease SbcCD ATPase subunit
MTQLKRDADLKLQELKNTLENERAARKHALAALATRLVRAETELTRKEEELATLSATHSLAAEAAKLAQDRLTKNELELTQLRSDLRTTEGDLDKKFDAVVALTDQLNQATSLRDELQERNTQAALQIAKMKMVMDANGLTVDSLVSHIPPKVEAVVLEVSDKDLIEISIGSDDGIKVGHAMEVYRDNTYLGRIIIRRVSGDRAVGQIVKELQRGQIKRGDRVSTKFS